MPQTATYITQLGRIFVPVSDQDEALAFYTETLGFALRVDISYGEGERWIEVVPGGGEAALALVPPREGQPLQPSSNVSLETLDIEAAHAELAQRGVEIEDIMRFDPPVPPMFAFKDPDGNTYMLVQREDG
jgi:lactoylglutathione lyase